ncbi:MAG TPA: heme lyase CcmF/NrfE family subunit [Candidatus Angelobacter sp.]|nr:heme lyase CcmF/NrfE family subunit [Candidatus Angelobacter sp.]
MPLLGSFCLLFSLALALYCFGAGFISLVRRSPASTRLGETARRAGLACFIALCGAGFALVWAALTNDFSLDYIHAHTNRALPVAYKISALWSGQEGSLLFWSLLLAGYGFVLRWRHKVDRRLYAYSSVVLAGIQVFFLLVVNLSANPFGVLSNVAADGNGLNPLLQYPEMVIHPPMLYMGYVGLSVPFAFALGALIMKYPGEKWIHITRRWTMVAWLFLTCGIFLGGHWAYSVLGWGGYWAWDPVENASLLPWLTGTAFLHSVMMQEKRGMMKVWNVWLIFITFLLTILGDFLTRSGIVASVHAFAQSDIGTWFVWMMGITLVVCLFFFIKNYAHLKSENQLESLVSRESSFMFNNVLLLAAAFFVLWGTLFPVITEWVKGHKITVGTPFFNYICIPIGLALLLLTGMGPLLAWRRTSWASIQKNFAIPASLSLATFVALFALGVRPVDFAHTMALIAVPLATLVAATILLEFIRGGRVLQPKLQTNVVGAMVHLTHRNTRRYGGYIAHFGVALIFLGIAGAAFDQDNEQPLKMGEKMQIGQYTLVSLDETQDDNANYTSYAAALEVQKGGKKIGNLYPEIRIFKASQQPDHMVAIRSTIKEDLYVIYAGRSDSNVPVIKAFIKPLVSWLWIGVLVVILGTAVALVPNAAPLKSLVPVAATAGVAQSPAFEKQMQPVGAGK